MYQNKLQDIEKFPDDFENLVVGTQQTPLGLPSETVFYVLLKPTFRNFKILIWTFDWKVILIFQIIIGNWAWECPNEYPLGNRGFDLIAESHYPEKKMAILFNWPKNS